MAKPKPKAASRLQKASERASRRQLRTRQAILDQFMLAFGISSSTTASATARRELNETIQKVKHHLYERDFAAAFATEGFREAYALRWSPGRAIAYLDILMDLVRSKHIETRASKIGVGEEGDSAFNVLCIGAGSGAELVALDQWVSYTSSTSCTPDRNDTEHASGVNVTLLDIADWSSVIRRLTAASSNSKLTTTFIQHDILSPWPTTTVSSPLADPAGTGKAIKETNLITLFFTLNELYTTSIPLTTTFLLNLTRTVCAGTQLLVIDSPGSYASVSIPHREDAKATTTTTTTTVNEDEIETDNENDTRKKTYPMQWLLDHTLLVQAGKHQWEKGHECPSRWCRLEDQEAQSQQEQSHDVERKSLRFPVKLEDLRCQVHLFRRL